MCEIARAHVIKNSPNGLSPHRPVRALRQRFPFVEAPGELESRLRGALKSVVAQPYRGQYPEPVERRITRAFAALRSGRLRRCQVGVETLALEPDSLVGNRREGRAQCQRRSGCHRLTRKIQ